MVKHTQTIFRLLPSNCLGLFDHFVGLALRELKAYKENTIVFIVNFGDFFLFGWLVGCLFV